MMGKVSSWSQVRFWGGKNSVYDTKRYIPLYMFNSCTKSKMNHKFTVNLMCQVEISSTATNVPFEWEIIIGGEAAHLHGLLFQFS